MTRLFPVLLLLFSLLLPQASRAETEFYGGVGVGYSTFQIDPIDFEGAAVAVRQFVGLNYGQYVGLELGYIDFGTVNDQVVLEPGSGSINDSIESWGYELALVGRYPLNEELDAFGKVGMLRWDSESTLETFPLASKVDGDDMIWGVGLDFRGAGRFHARIQADFVDIEFADSWWVLTASAYYAIPFGR
ncbi:MAG: outer membrane beta-barrel protein [Gammaproteobacteria bacterium]|nr:outer membrane beta-barrel protein [Gammaproteobacteria bacterium]